MSYTKAVIELHYLPSIAYMAKLSHLEAVFFEAHENYSKRSFRNRAHILTSSGVQRLSIPLAKGKNEQMPIRQVKIANDQNWQINHWRSIRTAYSRAPFYDYYADEMTPIFEKTYTELFDWNLDLFKLICDLIGVEINWTLTSDYDRLYDESVHDLRNTVTPQNWDRLNDRFFKSIPYAQVFQEKHGFVANVSALDLLFCKGPEAAYYLELCQNINY
ncbi:MAG: WbqC family protein [Bacteroidota bacterium]